MPFFSLILLTLLVAAAQVQSKAIDLEEIEEKLETMLEQDLLQRANVENAEDVVKELRGVDDTNYQTYKECMDATKNCEKELGLHAHCENNDKLHKYFCICNYGYTMKSGSCVSTGVKEDRDYWAGSFDQDSVQAMVDEWEELIRKQDAKAIADRYTEDCLYLHQIKGLRYGRKAIQQEYQEWFDAGTTDAVVVILREDRIGDDFFEVLQKIDILDDAHLKMYSTTALVLYKKVDGGFQTYLTSEVVNPSNP